MCFSILQPATTHRIASSTRHTILTPRILMNMNMNTTTGNESKRNMMNDEMTLPHNQNIMINIL